LTWGPNELSPGTKYKRSKIVFSVKYVAIILICLGTQLLQLPAQSLIGSPGTLLPRWLGRVVMHCAPDLTASECLSIFIFLSPLGSLAEILLIKA